MRESSKCNKIYDSFLGGNVRGGQTAATAAAASTVGPEKLHWSNVISWHLIIKFFFGNKQDKLMNQLHVPEDGKFVAEMKIESKGSGLEWKKYAEEEYCNAYGFLK